ncbi:hypothetical protein [Sporosarcina cascadiensis]|uniref:hypothetical protein n=1 Tax=Sporosarcina cascadiensis TaxID=2660747 RepID=UPI00129A17F5|nr:hypothetical protein [Sporosarcina cascadiensis]
MKGKTLAIGMVVFTIIVVAAIYFMVTVTFKNNPTQKNHQSMEVPSYMEAGAFGWEIG